MKESYVYILASKKNGTIYVGITTNLKQRIYQHKNHIYEGFTSKYNIHNLVHYEIFSDTYNAISREKVIKGWSRKKKIELIEKKNPNWEDLSKNWLLDSSLHSE